MKPIWLEHALKDKGQKEIPGPGANPRVIEALHHTTLPENMKHTDETPNCSAYMCMWFEEIGFPSPHSAAAIDWEGYGTGLSSLREGAIVVLNRPTQTNPNSRHVTLCIDKGDGSEFFTGFGGNQHDMADFSKYRKSEITAIRWPEGIK